MTNPLCKRIGAPENCQIPVEVPKCQGVVDVNGDGKEDLMIVFQRMTMTDQGIIPGANYHRTILNGAFPEMHEGEEALDKFVKTRPWVASKTKKEFRLGDEVVFEGKAYIIIDFNIPFFCAKNGAEVKAGVDPDARYAIVIPKEIIEQIEKSREGLVREATELKEKKGILSEDAFQRELKALAGKEEQLIAQAEELQQKNTVAIPLNALDFPPKAK